MRLHAAHVKRGQHSWSKLATAVCFVQLQVWNFHQSSWSDCIL